jgi:hypothetical protein
VLAAVAAVAAGGWFPDTAEGLRPTRDTGDVAAVLADLGAYRDVPVVSNFSDVWYMVSGRPAADTPRPEELSTGAERDVDSEVAELAAALPGGLVIQAFDPSYFYPGVDLRQERCAVELVPTVSSRSGFEITVLDLSGCATADDVASPPDEARAGGEMSEPDAPTP